MAQSLCQLLAVHAPIVQVVKVLVRPESISVMVLLHGFIKKKQKTPKPELDLAKERLI